MGQVLTKEAKQADEILENYFKEKDLVYYKREEDQVTIFLLPYSIKDRKIRIDIHVFVYPSNLCRMNFKSRLNPEGDFSKELLDMNSKLINGNLSVESDSDFVSFNTNFSVEDSFHINDLYRGNLFECLSVLRDLLDKNIIKADKFDEE